MIKKISFIVLIFISALSGVPFSHAADLPFQPGEKLTFELRWGIIPAGETTLSVLPVEAINGVSAFHCVMTTQSNSFVDVFYKVRDRVESYLDMKVTRSLLYRNHQREGGTKRDIVVQFDWDTLQAHYTNGEKATPPIPIQEGTFDPLGIFYYLRTMDLDNTTLVERPVTDGKKCVLGQGKIIRRESVTVPAGTFDTYLIEPELKDIGGVFKKDKNARIQLWVTTDRRHIPVKIQSKVAVGSFTGELVKAIFE